MLATIGLPAEAGYWLLSLPLLSHRPAFVGAAEAMWFGAALGALVLAISANFFLARLALFEQAVGRFALIASGCGVGLLCFVYAAYAFGIEMFAALLLYAALCELYVFLFTLVLGSVSANIVLRLSRGPLDDRRMNEIYSSVAMIELRIDRLLEKRLLLNDGCRICSSESGQRLAFAFKFLQRFLRHS